MTQAERVEFVRRHRKCRSVTVDGSESVCLNCIWYEQYYYKSFGDFRAWTPTNKGYCLCHEQQRGPLALPCPEFERREF